MNMRLCILFFFLLLHVATAFAIDNDREVIVNGRVALYGSVIRYCEGDSVKAEAMCVPVDSKGSYLSRPRAKSERLFNKLHVPYWPTTVILICAIICLTGFIPPRICAAISALASAVVCCWIWWLSSWIPLMSISDTLAVVALFLCIGMLTVKRRSTMVAGLVAAALLWVIAAYMGMHPAVRPLNQALMSSWLPIHVTLMTLAYALFLFAALCALSGPVGKNMRIILFWGEILLVAGVVTGGLWATEAWGRFWGWDPKECCALATAIIYGILISVWEGIKNKRILTVVAFLAVIFTWLGASYLGGLHSYSR